MSRSPRNSAKLEEFAKQFPVLRLSDIDETDRMYCKVCKTDFKFRDRNQIKRHLTNKRHINSNEDKVLKAKQSVFEKDLCNVFVSCNMIPNNVKKDKFKRFIEKHTQYVCPTRYTFDKTMRTLYNETIEEIKNQMRDQYYWLTVDETKDLKGRKVVNVVVGWLKHDCATKPFLLHTEFVDKCNAVSICYCVEKSLNILFDDNIERNKFLLLITDGPYYMRTAGTTLCKSFTKLIHVRCVAHALHNISELVSNHYFNVNTLISSGKALFVKCESRSRAFRETVNKLPPKTILTRWGSWIKAVIYYRDNYLAFRVFVKELNRKDCAHIGILQDLFDKFDCLEDIIFIANTFKELTDVITCIESNNRLLLESLSLVKTLHNNLSVCEQSSAKQAFEKLDSSLESNFGFTQLSRINDILNGKTDDKSGLNLNDNEIQCFRFAPITNAEVERSFSRYKWILDKRRTNFTEETLNYYMVVNYNNLIDI